VIDMKSGNLAQAPLGVRLTGAFLAIAFVPGIITLGRRLMSGNILVFSLDGAIVIWCLAVGLYLLCFVGATVAITGRVPNHLAGLTAHFLDKFKLRRIPTE
jgi:hypothetical protein